MSLPRGEDTLEKAKELRKNATPQEQRLWHCFFKKYPIKFYRQKPIGKYIVDFYCKKAMLVVELDGGQHLEPRSLEWDQKRTKYLESLGLMVVRYGNNQIDREFRNVCEDIDRLVRRRTGAV